MVYKFNIKKLCAPALIHLVISLVGLIVLLTASKDVNNMICVNNVKCNVGNKTLFFTVEGLLILFWTFVLDLLCKSGYKLLSWILILLPFILFFIIVTLVEFNKLMNDSGENYINA